jgi:hypothetical protein
VRFRDALEEGCHLRHEEVANEKGDELFKELAEDEQGLVGITVAGLYGLGDGGDGVVDVVGVFDDLSDEALERACGERLAVTTVAEGV